MSNKKILFFSLLQSRNYLDICLRTRLTLYLALLVLILFLSFIVLFLLSDTFFSAKTNLTTQLKGELEHYHARISTHFDNNAAYGIQLAHKLTTTLESTLTKQKFSFSQVSDNPQLIESLEKQFYADLYKTLRIADCSGVYVIIDATVNSSLPMADVSRAGLYLKFVNINSVKPVYSELMYTRGMHNIGTRHGHTFHNQWELEFNLTKWSFWDYMKKNAQSDPSSCYYFTPRELLPNTWENLILLCVPMVGKDGTFYGICGLEINSLLFKLTYRSENVVFPNITGMLALREGNNLLPSSGLVSGMYAESFEGQDRKPLIIEKDTDLLSYTSDTLSYIGVAKDIRLSPLDKDGIWQTCLFIPEDYYHQLLFVHYVKLTIFTLIFLTLAFLLCLFVARRFLDPVFDSIQAVTSGKAEQTAIPEINDLIVYLTRQDAQASSSPNNVNMAGYDLFIKSIDSLTRTENKIFNLYLKGYSAQEVASQLFISINTIKSHNRRIYAKLNISSRKELLIYAQMMHCHIQQHYENYE